MKFFVALFLALTCHIGYAAPQATFDTNGLSKEQVAALQKSVDILKAQNREESSVMALDTASRWASEMPKIAEGFARALGVAAKEMNVAVNDFVNTDAGRITAALIIWKVAGHDVMKYTWSFAAALIIFIIMRKFDHTIRLSSTRVETETRYFGLISRKRTVPVYESFRDMTSEQAFILIITYLASIGGILIVVGVLS